MFYARQEVEIQLSALIRGVDGVRLHLGAG